MVTGEQQSAQLAADSARLWVRIEHALDGSVICWVDPRAYNVTMDHPQGGGVRIVISPRLQNAPSAPTQLTSLETNHMVPKATG